MNWYRSLRIKLDEAATSGKWEKVSFDSLPSQTIYDICEWLFEEVPYFERDRSWTDVKSLLVGTGVQVWRGMVEVDKLYPTMDRKPSDAVVSKYVDMLHNPSFNFDPIFTENGKFLDGGHRMEAYKRAGRKFIPVIDIGNLLKASTEEWEEWYDGDNQNPFDLDGHPQV